MTEFWFTYTNMTFECMWVDDEESACHPIRKLFWSPAFISSSWCPAESFLVVFAQRSPVHYRTSCMDPLLCTHLLLGDQMVSLLCLLHRLVFFIVGVFFSFPVGVPTYFNLGRQPSVAFAWIHLGPILGWCCWPMLGFPYGRSHASSFSLLMFHASVAIENLSFSFIKLFFMEFLKLFPRGEIYIWQRHSQDTAKTQHLST